MNQALNGTTDDRKIIVSESDSDQSLEESLLVKTKTSRPKAKVLETDDDESEDEAFESAKNSFNGRKDSEEQEESEQDESVQDESAQDESEEDESSDPDEWSPDGNDQDYSALNGHSNPAEISSSEVSKMNELYC